MKKSYLYSIVFITLLFVSCAKPPVEILDTSKEIELDCFTVKLPPERNWTVENLVGGFPPSWGYCYDHFVFTSNQEELFFLISFFNNTTPRYALRDEFTSEYFLKKILKQESDTDAEIEIVNGVKDFCIKSKKKTISSVPPPIEGLKLKTSEKYYNTYLTYYVTESPFNGFGITYTISFMYISTDEHSEQELETKALNFLKNVKFQKDLLGRLDKI